MTEGIDSDLLCTDEALLAAAKNGGLTVEPDGRLISDGRQFIEADYGFVTDRIVGPRGSTAGMVKGVMLEESFGTHGDYHGSI